MAKAQKHAVGLNLLHLGVFAALPHPLPNKDEHWMTIVKDGKFQCPGFLLESKSNTPSRTPEELYENLYCVSLIAVKLGRNHQNAGKNGSG